MQVRHDDEVLGCHDPFSDSNVSRASPDDEAEVQEGETLRIFTIVRKNTMAVSSLPGDVSIVGGNSVASDKGGVVEQKS